jgi:hypothetical protein
MEAFLRPKKFLAFGDSYVLMFMHAKNAVHYKFKGKSIKGLSKESDPDRARIEKIVKEHKDGSLVFSFGQVDLNFIRYYKLAHKESYEMETFEKYIEWIASLKRKSYVIGMLASPIKK